MAKAKVVIKEVIKEQCILHGERLNHLEKQVGDLHDSLYANGFQKKIHKIEMDGALALDRIKTNNRLTWAILSVIIISAGYTIWRR